MVGMPEMQEQFSAMIRDGRYAGPPVLQAPAGTSHIPVGRKCRSNFLAMTLYAGSISAGA